MYAEDAIREQKIEVILGSNKETNRFATSTTEIEFLERTLASVIKAHKDADHDLMNDVIFELEYAIAVLKKSELIDRLSVEVTDVEN